MQNREHIFPGKELQVIALDTMKWENSKSSTHEGETLYESMFKWMDWPISILLQQIMIKDVHQAASFPIHTLISNSTSHGTDSPCRRLVPESTLSPCLCSLCFLRASRHGVKKSCLRASSALILCRGFTIKHLSTRSNSDLGMASKKSRLRVFRAHQSRRFTGGKYFTSSRSCFKVVLSEKVLSKIRVWQRFLYYLYRGE